MINLAPSFSGEVMRKFLMVTAAVLAALLVVASCDEQSPEAYLAPEFGPVEVNLDGFSATVTCNVTGPQSGFNYGFILQEGNGTQTQEIALKPSGGVIEAELEGLTPLTDYYIKAFATNGKNTVTSAENHFKTAKEEDVRPAVNIPDPTFKKFILDKFDSNNDGHLSQEEADGISAIECCTDDIRSIEGVEHFTNLESLTCRGSGAYSGRRTGLLTKVDLSKNYCLRYIGVDGNNLTELRLPDKSSNITDIHCTMNKLDSLDLSNCPKLKLLYCWENSLTSLNLSSNLFLTDLRCAQNDFSNGLDVSANTELRYFACNNTFMQAIDVSANKELIELMCWDNAIREIDVSHNLELTKLECSDNLLKSIDVSHNSQLEVFTCENNSLKEIDVSNNLNLRVFFCTNNQLSSLDISMLTKLRELWLGDNSISGPLDLSMFPDLILYGGNNLPLDRMPDFSHNPKLTSIHICGSGGALYMEPDFFRDWPEISSLNICCYPGETVDLSLNTKMEDLWMSDMHNIKILDLSASPKLRGVWLERCEKLEKVYLHKDVDLSRIELNMSGTNATIEFK